MTEVKMLWVDGALNWVAHLSVASFFATGHRVVLYTYNRDLIAPSFVELRDANEVLPAKFVFEYRDGWSKGYLSGFANWFRYELLLQEPGWWSDCDVVAMRHFGEPDEPYRFASGWEPAVSHYVNNNVIFCRHDEHHVLREAIAQCRKLGDSVKFAETGPVLLHKLVHQHCATNFIAHWEDFNPIHYGDVKVFGDARVMVFLKQWSRRIRGLRPIGNIDSCFAIHLYGNLFQRQFSDIRPKDFREGSIIKNLAEKIAPELLD